MEAQALVIKVTHGEVNANRCAEVSLPYLSFNSITLDNLKQVSGSGPSRSRLRGIRIGRIAVQFMQTLMVTNKETNKLRVCHENTASMRHPSFPFHSISSVCRIYRRSRLQLLKLLSLVCMWFSSFIVKCRNYRLRCRWARSLWWRRDRGNREAGSTHDGRFDIFITFSCCPQYRKFWSVCLENKSNQRLALSLDLYIYLFIHFFFWLPQQRLWTLDVH